MGWSSLRKFETMKSLTASSSRTHSASTRSPTLKSSYRKSNLSDRSSVLDTADAFENLGLQPTTAPVISRQVNVFKVESPGNGTICLPILDTRP
jgi:hypothetical protein